MSEASQPDSVTKKKKGRGGFGVLKDENERLKARLAELEGAAATVGPKPPAVVGGYDPSIDPLAWIDEGVDSVHLVGKISHLTGNTVPTPSRAEGVVESVRAYALKDWNYCPFKLEGRTREESDNLAIQYAKWHHHRVDRFYAERVFASKWAPFPKVACVASDSFAGKDHQGNPHGKRTPCSTDPLRELVRYYLQRYAGMLWLDFVHHRAHIRVDLPNPYGAGREKFAVDPATVRKADKEGNILTDWTLSTGRR